MLDTKEGNNFINTIQKIVGGAVDPKERAEIITSLNFILPRVIEDDSGVNEANLVGSIAGETIGSDKLVYSENGKVYLYNANDEALSGRLLGITKNAAVQNEIIKVQVQGLCISVGFNRIPGVYYAGLMGGMVLDPTGLKVVQQVGIAISGEEIMLRIVESIITT